MEDTKSFPSSFLKWLKASIYPPPVMIFSGVWSYWILLSSRSSFGLILNDCSWSSTSISLPSISLLLVFFIGVGSRFSDFSVISVFEVMLASNCTFFDSFFSSAFFGSSFCGLTAAWAPGPAGVSFLSNFSLSCSTFRCYSFSGSSLSPLTAWWKSSNP